MRLTPFSFAQDVSRYFGPAQEKEVVPVGRLSLWIHAVIVGERGSLDLAPLEAGGAGLTSTLSSHTSGLVAVHVAQILASKLGLLRRVHRVVGVKVNDDAGFDLVDLLSMCCRYTFATQI